jgi:hypothetical protein
VTDDRRFSDSVIHFPVKDVQVGPANAAMRNAKLDFTRGRSDRDTLPNANQFIAFIKRSFQSMPPICPSGVLYAEVRVMLPVELQFSLIAEEGEVLEVADPAGFGGYFS